MQTGSSVASLPVLLKRARHLLSAALFILMVVSAYGAFVGISVIHALPSEGMNTYRGHAYTVDAPTFHRLWPLHFDSDSLDHSDASSMRLLEDGLRLGPAHSMHARIAEVGVGAYSHWGDAVYFSASDNSDPRSNGNAYVFAVTAYLPMEMSAWVAAAAVGGLLLWQKSLVRGAKSRLHVRHSEQIARAALLRISWSLSSLIVAVLCVSYLPVIAQGAIYWLLLAAVAIAAFFAMRSATMLGSCFFDGIREWNRSGTLVLLVVSIGVGCAGMEIGLYLLRGGMGGPLKARPLIVRSGKAQITLPADLVVRMQERRRLVTMPEEFSRGRGSRSQEPTTLSAGKARCIFTTRVTSVAKTGRSRRRTCESFASWSSAIV